MYLRLAPQSRPRTGSRRAAPHGRAGEGRDYLPAGKDGLRLSPPRWGPSFARTEEFSRAAPFLDSRGRPGGIEIPVPMVPGRTHVRTRSYEEADCPTTGIRNLMNDWLRRR